MQASAEAPCSLARGVDIRLCCVDGAAPEIPAIISVDAGPRLLELALAAVLPLGIQWAGAGQATFSSRQSREPLPLPAADRLAFLGVYLI